VRFYENFSLPFLSVNPYSVAKSSVMCILPVFLIFFGSEANPTTAFPTNSVVSAVAKEFLNASLKLKIVF